MYKAYVAGIKKCRNCGLTKDHRSYFKANGNADGYENVCKPCKKLLEDPVKRRARIKLYRANLVASFKYGVCKDCKGPLGRNDNGKGLNKSGCCKNCAKGENHPNYTGGYINQDGYRITYVAPRKTMLEHRYVMQQHLGRKLHKDENVHHINGVKDDNRIENLELWSTYQPCGQRIQDKVEWAKEILRRYEPIS